MKSYLKIFVVVALSLVIVNGCQKKQEKPTNQNDVIAIPRVVDLDAELPWEKVCTLKENLEPVGDISSLSMLDDSGFVAVVDEPAQAILFDKDGKQLRKLGSTGRGPFEYSRPSIVRTGNGNIYIWCSNLTRLLVYDASGEPVDQHNFSRAVKDFVVYKHHIGFYAAGGFTDEPILKLYDLNKEKFVEGYGKKTNEHRILNTIACAGGLARNGNFLYFAPIERNIIWQINPDDFSSKQYRIEDPEFEVEKVNEDAKEFVPNIKKVIPYISGSDVIAGMFSTDEGFLVKAHVGAVKMDGLKVKDDSQRRHKYYVFDRNMNLQYAVRAKVNLRSFKDCLYASAGKYLYAIRLNAEADGFELVRADLFGY